LRPLQNAPFRSRGLSSRSRRQAQISILEISNPAYSGIPVAEIFAFLDLD